MNEQPASILDQVLKAWENVLAGNNLTYGLPRDISTDGAGIDHLFYTLHYFMLALFIGWGIYLVYCLIKFRERPGHVADVSVKHFSLPKYLEFGIVIFEASLLIFFSYPIWAKVKRDFPNENDALVVHVVAEQFAWNVHYPGKDGIFGKGDISLMDGTNPLGLNREEADAKDDIVSPNNLVVPVGKPVIVHLRSKDVIHSFFLLEARVKQDAIPGMEIPLWFNTQEAGNFEISCAQLCGVGHAKMRGFFKVLPQEEYDKWLAEEQAAVLESGA